MSLTQAILIPAAMLIPYLKWELLEMAPAPTAASLSMGDSLPPASSCFGFSLVVGKRHPRHPQHPRRTQLLPGGPESARTWMYPCLPTTRSMRSMRGDRCRRSACPPGLLLLCRNPLT